MMPVTTAVLIICSVLNPDSTPHETNTRAKLEELLTPDVVAEKPLYGFEQVRVWFLQRPCSLQGMGHVSIRIW
jgi:hypothetical protein